MKIFDRIEKVRIALRLNKGEVCARLGIKRTMLHYLKTEERNLGMPALRELERLEAETGLHKDIRFALADTGVNKFQQLYQDEKTRADRLEKELAQLKAVLAKLGK